MKKILMALVFLIIYLPSVSVLAGEFYMCNDMNITRSEDSFKAEFIGNGAELEVFDWKKAESGTIVLVGRYIPHHFCPGSCGTAKFTLVIDPKIEEGSHLVLVSQVFDEELGRYVSRLSVENLTCYPYDY
jgi:hypothetical protein